MVKRGTEALIAGSALRAPVDAVIGNRVAVHGLHVEVSAFAAVAVDDLDADLAASTPDDVANQVFGWH
jgi:hypothetical protein